MDSFKDLTPEPPMGWNSFDSYHGAITEKQFKNAVDFLARKMLPLGWEHAVIDFFWFHPGPEDWPFNKNENKWQTFTVSLIRDQIGDIFPKMCMDEYGRLLPAVNRFPSAANGNGFKLLADYVHNKGMKFGLHIMRGIPRQAADENTTIKGTEFRARDIIEERAVCYWNNAMFGIDHNKPGAQEYYNSLFELYAEWGVDFIKADDMMTPFYHKGEIEMMRKAIDQCGRPIALSLSCGKAPIARASHLQNHANMWRISGD